MLTDVIIRTNLLVLVLVRDVQIRLQIERKILNIVLQRMEKGFLSIHVNPPRSFDRSFRRKHSSSPSLSFMQIINQLEERRAKAYDEHREEYAKKLRRAIRELEEAGQELGIEVALYRKAIDRQDYEEAKTKKEDMEQKRQEIYRENNVSDLLELTGKNEANDELRPGTQAGGGSSPREELPPPSRHKQKPRSRSSSPRQVLVARRSKTAELPPPR